MNGKPETSGALLDNWHLRMLNLDTELEARPQSPEILKQLEASAFLPNLHLDTAIQQLVSGEVSPARKWQSCEQLLRRDVEAFAEQFFQLPVSDRRAIHSRLLKDAEHFPVLKRRLLRLVHGLDLQTDLPDGLSNETYRLRDLLQQLLTFSPRDGALIRREWQADIERNRAVWIDVVRQLARHAPALVQISPEVTDWIVTPPKPKRRVKPVQLRTPATTESGSSSRGWVIALVVFAAIRIFTIFARMEDHQPPLSNQFSQRERRDIQEFLAGLEEPKVPDFNPPRPGPAVAERERLQDELKRDAAFQAKLELLPTLPEDRVLEFGSDRFAVTRENGQLVILFKNITSQLDLLSTEQELLGTKKQVIFVQPEGTAQLHLQDYVMFRALRDDIAELQPTPLLSISGANSSQPIFAFEGTRAIYLDPGERAVWTAGEDPASSADSEQAFLLDSIDALEEGASLAVGTERFKVLRQGNRLHIVFRDRAALAPVVVCDTLPPESRERSQLYKQTKADYKLFLEVAKRIAIIQNQVFVTYPGLKEGTFQPRPQGTQLSYPDFSAELPPESPDSARPEPPVSDRSLPPGETDE